MDIQGATAIVLRGASGLGEATARRLAAEEAEVVVADLADDRAATLAAEIDGHAVACDVTRPESVQAAVGLAASLDERGLCIAVTCAGVGTPTKLIGRDGPTANRSRGGGSSNVTSLFAVAIAR